MRRRLWKPVFIVGLVVIAVVAYWLHSSFGDLGGSSSFEYPTQRADEILACDRDGVWLSIMDAVPGLSGPAEPGAVLASRRAVWIPRAGNPQATEFGPAVARTLSVASDGSRWLVVQEPTDEFNYRGSSRLLHAGSGQATWEDRPVPGALIGAVFETDLKGFAWSVDTVFGTADGGLTWRAASLAPWLVPGPRMPALIPAAQGGGLLVPLKTLPLGDGSSRLLRVGSDMSLKVLAQWDHVSIEGITVAGDQIAVASKPWLVGPSRLDVAKLGDAQLQFREVWSSEKERVHSLQSIRRSVYFIATGEWGKSGFLGATPRALMKTTADSWTWTRADITQRRVQSMCATREGIWTLGGWKRHVAFFRSE
jgi:hypothetical protein